MCDRIKIALFGNFGTGNLGNEATLQAMLVNLRERFPNVEISCICPSPDIVTADYKIPAFAIKARFPYREILRRLLRLDVESVQPRERTFGSFAESQQSDKTRSRTWALLQSLVYPFFAPYRWFKVAAALKGSDALVMTGTGMLGDFGITPFGLHYDILLWSIFARLCGSRLLFVSVGAGPIRHALSRCFVKAALRLAHYRSYRDDFSKRYLARIGFNTKNDCVFPDLAFSCPRSMLNSVARNNRGVTVGLGVMNYHDRLARSGSNGAIYRSYVTKLVAIVGRLIDGGYAVRIVIGDTMYDNEVRRDLRKLMEAHGLEYDDGKIVDEPASSVDEIVAQLASVDIVVASRFHNLVLALMLGKPVVATAYHEKFQSLLTGVGLGEFCQDIEQIDVDDLILKIEKLREDVPRLKHQITLVTGDYRAALDQQYELILEIISSQARRKSGAETCVNKGESPVVEPVSNGVVVRDGME